jgi:hypothetical protein
MSRGIQSYCKAVMGMKQLVLSDLYIICKRLTALYAEMHAEPVSVSSISLPRDNVRVEITLPSLCIEEPTQYIRFMRCLHLISLQI